MLKNGQNWPFFELFSSFYKVDFYVEKYKSNEFSTFCFPHKKYGKLFEFILKKMFEKWTNIIYYILCVRKRRV